VTIAVWIVSGILALAFLGSGAMKLLRQKSALQTQMAYVEDLTGWRVKVIGALEVLGAIGLIVPALTGIAPILTPIAALCLAVSQIFAFALHAKRGELKGAVPINGLLILGSLFVAVTRFLGY
jgi:uncharacterized membrane protein